MCRSPMYAHLSRTMEGLFVLHSFPNATASYLQEFEFYLSEHTRAMFNFILVSRWLGSRLDMVVFIVTIVVVFTAVEQRESAADTGLSISYLLQLSGMFQWMVRQSASNLRNNPWDALPLLGMFNSQQVLIY